MGEQVGLEIQSPKLWCEDNDTNRGSVGGRLGPRVTPYLEPYNYYHNRTVTGKLRQSGP